MLIVRAMGGLGNQLQQYALYRKLEHIGKDVRLDTSWFRNEAYHATMAAERDLELDYLNPLPYKEASEEEIRSVLGRLWEEPESIFGKMKRKLHPASVTSFEESDMYHEQIFAMDRKYLVGYWACEKYYADIMDILRKEIRFPDSSDSKVKERNDEVSRQMDRTCSVSVHIRRGDYLDDINQALFGGICTCLLYTSPSPRDRG